MLGVAGLLGCEDAFVAHVDTVARADGAELKVNRLAEIVAAAPDIPIDHDVIELLAYRWAELTTFARRIAAGDSLLDSALIMHVMWPNVRGVVVDSFHTLLIDEKIDVQPSQVDSAFRAGNMRFLGHILRRVTDSMTAEEKAAQRATAERIHRRLVDGGSWDAANRENDDELARNQGGMLGVVTRGATVPRFENAAFALPAGDISNVVETQFGYHIIFRPRLDNVREPFTEAVRSVFSQRLDSLYEDELLVARGVEFRPGAVAAIREAYQAPLRHRRSTKVLAGYRNGAFTVRDFVRWLQILPPQIRQQLVVADDAQLLDLARSLITRELIFVQADSAGIRITPEQFRVIADGYRRQLTELERALELDPDSLAKYRPTVPERQDLATVLVDQFLERGVKDTRQLIPVPPFLADSLMETVDWEVSQSGINRVVERAAALRAALPAAPAPKPGGDTP